MSKYFPLFHLDYDKNVQSQWLHMSTVWIGGVTKKNNNIPDILSRIHVIINTMEIYTA